MLFNELPDDVIIEIFNWMTPTELLALERVDKLWQRMVQETLEHNVKTVVMKEPPADESRRVPKVCSHLTDVDPRRMISLDKMFGHLFNKWIQDGVGIREIETFQNIQRPKEMQAFISVLSKLGGVRSIDFAERHISVQTLVQSFELCPKLECIAVDGRSFNKLNEKYLIEFFKSFGSRLVHFTVFNNEDSKKVFRLLSSASNYLRLERMDIEVNSLSEDSVSDIKQLQQPKNAYLVLRLYDMSVVTLLDFIDVLMVRELSWNSLSDNCQRLSLLSFGTLEPELESPDEFKPIEFSNLKYIAVNRATGITLRVLIRCRFLSLKELKLHFFLEFVLDVDQLLEQLFDKMPNLVKIDIKDFGMNQIQVPGPAVLRLTRLKEIVWSVCYFPDWNSQLMADSFDVIKQMLSLKKLTFKYMMCNSNIENQWLPVIEQQLDRLKQQRPGLVVESVRVHHWPVW